jgi:hypothetical protein
MPVFRAEVYHVLAFIAAMFALSAFREYFGVGALWGIPIADFSYRLSGVSVPFAGFILLGFYIAFLRFSNRRLMGFLIRSDYRHQTRFEVRRVRD